MKPTVEFKRVPAIDKCFSILEAISKSDRGMGISETARVLGYNKSTVFNIVHTLRSLGILENNRDNRFVLGPGLYVLGTKAAKNFNLADIAHPWLEKVAMETRLSAFVGTLSRGWIVIIDKVDSPVDIKVSSEIGMRIPLFAGATGKVLLAQMAEEEARDLLRRKKLKRYTPNTCTDPEKYLRIVQEVRRQGFALDKEEYIDGIRAIAVPVRNGQNSAPSALWVVGLSSQLRDQDMHTYANFLKEVGRKVERRLSPDGTR
ncbi:MAG: IclR family transcriptional regulator [Deltaproteobacteria bacterium]|nr:IclR family transcriptional regulator [Deltaproteobacteria bacterium]MBW2083270.1 IclR family transcriptional regulator [Deltaproteobacteria bacterium]